MPRQTSALSLGGAVEDGETDDLATLTHLDEQSMLRQLGKRYARDVIYVSAQVIFLFSVEFMFPSLGTGAIHYTSHTKYHGHSDVTFFVFDDCIISMAIPNGPSTS